MKKSTAMAVATAVSYLFISYLKYTFNESDENVVARWVEYPYWQYFCGFEQLRPTSLTKWGNRVDDKLEALLAVALETKALKPHALKHVNVNFRVD